MTRTPTGSAKGSPAYRRAAFLSTLGDRMRRMKMATLVKPMQPILSGRMDGVGVVLEIRCQTEEAARIAERILQEVLGC